MNDRHPSGSSTPPPSAPGADYPPYATYDQQSAPHGGYGYDAYSTGSCDTGVFDTGTFATDPLFGEMSGAEYDTGQWATAPDARQPADTAQQPATYATYAGQQHGAYDTDSHDTSGWSTGAYQHLADIPSQQGPDSTGQWDTTNWNQPPATGQWETQSFDTGAYDATAWNSAGDSHETQATHEPAESETPQPYEAGVTGETGETGETYESTERYELTEQYEISAEAAYADADSYEGGNEDPYEDAEHEPAAHVPVPAPRAARGKSGGPGAGRSRTRRRTPAKRSALLTVAVPSACVMGVAGVAAASVGSFGGDDHKETAASVPDAASVQPSTANNKLDTQLANLSADAGDFADRASRTQERIDLKAQKVAAQKQAAAEAARKERMRPKFVLPVKQHGLSAQYGQAGVNWMSAHSGIDFPVSYGTEVFAATDGTVTTKWNSAYGNMAIVTAKDGTETWYCHLSQHKISSGPVKAGETIAFSGNSGNSTGPHLHFEVRPSHGSAIDPLPWLRSHGLDPT